MVAMKMDKTQDKAKMWADLNSMFPDHAAKYENFEHFCKHIDAATDIKVCVVTGTSYDPWETDIADAISNLLDCDYGDASGIIEANPFIMAQAWAMGLTADQTASKIVNQ